MLFGEQRDRGKTNWPRVLIGIVFAPAIPFVILLPTAWVLMRVWYAVFPEHPPNFNPASVMVFIYLGPPFAYVTTIFVGLPMFLLYQRCEWRGRIHYALGGLVACYVAALPVHLFAERGGATWANMLLLWVMNGGMVGVFIAVPAALIFWWIMLGSDPNHDAGQRIARTANQAEGK